MEKKIVACIDGSFSAMDVCDWSSWLQQRLQAPLTLLHVLEKTSQVQTANLSGVIGMDSREDLLEQLTQLDEKREQLALAHGKQMLTSALERVQANGAAQADIRQRHGDLVETLLELEADIRVLVMGRQGEQSAQEHSQVGSQLESVIRTLPCPVLVAATPFTPPASFMLAFDGSATAQSALQRVIDSPLLQGLTCHLVMAGDHQPGKLQQAEQLLRHAGFSLIVKSLSGDKVTLLNDYANASGVGLIVMGAYGHSRIRQFFIGSNTATLLRTAKTPLLILR